MNYSPFDYLALFVVSGLLVGFITPKFRNFALKRNIFDSPNSSHKTHNEPVPYLGGLAIAIGVVVVSLTVTFTVEPNLFGRVIGILIPPICLASIGLIDDLQNLAPFPRFLAQTIAGIAVAIIMIRNETIGAPTGSLIWDFAITIIFIVGLSNSINFFDNVDGGASGTVAISTLFLSVLAYLSGQFYLGAIAIIMSGATIGFLWWNRSPARIYMGDAGSLFLGSLLASILVRFDPSPIIFPNYFFVPLFLIAVPLLDTSTVIISRIAKKLSPFKGGRDHLSHRLMRVGIPKVRSVTILWMLTCLFCLFATALSFIKNEIQDMLVFVGLGFWSLLLVYFLNLPSEDDEKNHRFL